MYWGEREDSLMGRFFANARSQPQLWAVRSDQYNLTYGELAQLAGRVSEHLLFMGVGFGGLVAIGMNPTPALIVAMLGIMRTGAAYVPIDIHAPETRNAFILNDSKVKVFLGDRTSMETYGREDKAYSFLEITSLLQKEKYSEDYDFDWLLDFEFSFDNFAYVIYTSGTTGKPKGVPISYANLQALFQAAENYFSFLPSDRGVLYHSYAFDFSVWEIWTMLGYGGCLTIPDYFQKTNAKIFANFLVNQKITFLNQTPTSFSVNSAEIIALIINRLKCLSLRCVVFGGERLNMTLLESWGQQFGFDDIALVNMYGITETTVHATYHRITQSDLGSTDSIIGRPLDGFEFSIRAFNGNDREVGELLLSGPPGCEGIFKPSKFNK